MAPKERSEQWGVTKEEGVNSTKIYGFKMCPDDFDDELMR